FVGELAGPEASCSGRLAQEFADRSAGAAEAWFTMRRRTPSRALQRRRFTLRSTCHVGGVVGRAAVPLRGPSGVDGARRITSPAHRVGRSVSSGCEGMA